MPTASHSDHGQSGCGRDQVMIVSFLLCTTHASAPFHRMRIIVLQHSETSINIEVRIPRFPSLCIYISRCGGAHRTRSTIATCIMTSTIKSCLNFEPVSCVTSIHSPIKCSPKSRAMCPKIVRGCLVHGIRRLLSTNLTLFANALEQFCEIISSIIQWYHA